MRIPLSNIKISSLNIPGIEQTFSSKRHNHLLKTFWREWPTQCHLYQCHQSHTTTCQICQMVDKNTLHIFCCSQMLSLTQSALTSYHSTLKTRKVPHHVQVLFLQNVVNVLLDKPPFPPTFNTTKIDCMTLQAFSEQSKIGW